MKIKMFHPLILVTMVSIIFSNQVMASNLITGIKAGASYSKLGSLKESANLQEESYPQYSYPAAFFVAIYKESKLANNVSIINELSFVNVISKVKIATGYEGILNQEYNGKYLHYACLFKLQPDWFLAPYLLMGPDCGYLVNASFDFYDEIYNYGNSYKITSNVPRFDLSSNFGMGIKLDRLNYALIGEARLLLALTECKYQEGGFGYIGKWKNRVFQLVLGIEF